MIESGRPSFGIRMLYTLFKVMAPFKPKRCLSERWPIDGGSSNGGVAADKLSPAPARS